MGLLASPGRALMSYQVLLFNKLYAKLIDAFQGISGFPVQLWDHLILNVIQNICQVLVHQLF